MELRFWVCQVSSKLRNIYSLKPNSLSYKLSTIWACFEKSSVLRALSTRQIKKDSFSFHIVLRKQYGIGIGKETRGPFEMSYRYFSSMKNC